MRFPSRELSLIKGLRRPPTPRAFFYFCAPSRLKRGRGAASALPVCGVVVSSVFISSSAGHFERGEGLAPFSYRGRSGASVRPWRPRSLAHAKKGTWRPRTNPRVKPEDRGDKDRLIDPMSGIEFARKRARTGFEPLRIADGRQPFMPLRGSHDPCLQNLSLRFAHARRMRPLSVGRLDDAFHPATPHHCGIPGVCRLISLISIVWLIGKGVAGAYRAGRRGSLESHSVHPAHRPVGPPKSARCCRSGSARYGRRTPETGRRRYGHSAPANFIPRRCVRTEKSAGANSALSPPTEYVRYRGTPR